MREIEQAHIVNVSESPRRKFKVTGFAHNTPARSERD
jgi:hypothetical protein